MHVLDLHTIRNSAQKDMSLMTDNAGLGKGIKNFVYYMASCGFVFIF